MSNTRRSAILALTVLLVFWISGCTPSPGAAREESLTDRAGAEATALLQRAEATAIILRAQATAAALTQGKSGPAVAPSPAASAVAPATPRTVATEVTTPTAAAAMSQSQATPAFAPSSASTLAEKEGSDEAVEPGVQSLAVSIAGDGDFIRVQFLADPEEVQSWAPGNVSVIDEATGTSYSEIPVMGSVGILFARPQQPGQSGYIMFTNYRHGVKPGSVVTVVLGDTRREHVIVQ